MENTFTIAAAAKAADVGVETIRYYQRRGLVSQPSRRVGAYRHYDRTHVARIRFIRRAQELGFTLDEIASLLQLQDGANRTKIRRVASVRLQETRARIADLRRMEHALQHLLTECEAGVTARCPIIDAIASEG